MLVRANRALTSPQEQEVGVPPKNCGVSKLQRRLQSRKLQGLLRPTARLVRLPGVVEMRWRRRWEGVVAICAGRRKKLALLSAITLSAATPPYSPTANQSGVPKMSQPLWDPEKYDIERMQDRHTYSSVKGPCESRREVVVSARLDARVMGKALQ